MNCTNIINKIKANKRILYLSFCIVLILFSLILNITFSIMMQNNNMIGSNIIIGDLKYNMIINEVTIDDSVGTKDTTTSIVGDRILRLKSGLAEEFNIVLTSLNDIDTKYEITYKVCTDINCTNFIDNPSNITVSYHEDTPNINGTISANKSISVMIVTNNQDSEEHYILVTLNVGYSHNELALTNQISDSFSPGSLNGNLTIIAVVDGVEVETFPTEPNYETNITCTTSSGETDARGLFRYSATDGWELDVYGLNKNLTTCRVEFTKLEPITYDILATKLKCSNYNTTLSDDDAIMKYTGPCTLINDSSLTGSGNWRIKFKDTGTYTLTVRGLLYIDVFLVGGGGSGSLGSYPNNGGVGSGGTVLMYPSVRLINGTSYKVVVGEAGSNTSFGDYLPATAGKTGGGTGGDGKCEFLSTTSSACLYTDNGYSGHYGAQGEQTTYGGGTAGCACCVIYGLGCKTSGNGVANTGAGGGKGHVGYCGNEAISCGAGTGGSGIAIIRNSIST